MIEQPKKKRTRKPKLAPKGEQRLIQARLNSLRMDDPARALREKEAIEFIDRLRNEDKQTDREFLTDALLLYRQKREKGYRAPMLTTARLTEQMQSALTMILDHIKMLSTLDLTSLRSQPTWNEDHFQKTSSHLHESAADFLGTSKTYYTDDD